MTVACDLEAAQVRDAAEWILNSVFKSTMSDLAEMHKNGCNLAHLYKYAWLRPVEHGLPADQAMIVYAAVMSEFFPIGSLEYNAWMDHEMYLLSRAGLARRVS